MKYGIIGAMDVEIGMMQQRLRDVHVEEIGGMEFHLGSWLDKSVVLVRSGICKVNAALCAQLLLTRYNVDAVIFTGVAGALDPSLDVGDVVISRDTLQHDVDATAFGYQQGQVPGHEQAFTADPILVARAQLAASRNLEGKNILVGRVLSGDVFVADRTQARKLRDEFGGACVEMEGAAVAQTCNRYQVPFVIIRSMSDRADGSASADFNSFVQQAAINAAHIVENILEEE